MAHLLTKGLFQQSRFQARLQSQLNLLLLSGLPVRAAAQPVSLLSLAKRCTSTTATTVVYPAAAGTVWQRLAELKQAYKELSKARLSALVVSTACAGYVAGSGEHINWSGLGWTAVGTMATASSANALNQWYEASRDALMNRTRRRPLPTGRLSGPHALAFAACMGVGGVALLAWQTNSLAAGLAAGNILLYAGVYTPLKVVSIANTWVGALVGAVPPLLGWAAASGSLEPGSAMLAAALYFWQIPHFLSLAWLCREDYARGGYRMMSLTDPSGRRLAACMLRNCIYLVPIGLSAAWLGVTTPAFSGEAAVLTGAMAAAAGTFYRRPSNAGAKVLFRCSLVYLPLFMTGLCVHRLPNNKDQEQPFRAHFKLPSLISTSNDALGCGPLQQDGRQKAYYQLLVAPFPFLPVPMQLKCPSKVACEAAEEGKERAETECEPYI